MSIEYPAWICHECGINYCNGNNSLYATFHIGTCECCKKEKIPVTEPRDYGHLVKWPITIDSKNVK